ncbi:MAG: FG-GAP-like repeat-containing protein [Bacteroidota bacterium]
MKRSTILLILVFLFGINNAITAQHIKRKGKLGVQLAQAEENAHGAPFQIAQVFESSTASSLQMKVGDIIITVNGQAFNSGEAIQKVVGSFVEDEPVIASVQRAGQVLQLTGKVIPPPLQVHAEHAEVLLGEVPYLDGYVRSIVNKPKGTGPFKTIYYLQGYPCQSVDYALQHPTMRLITSLVDQGYAVFRVEKPGVGEYYNCKPCQEQSFDNEVEAFANGLAELKKQAFVDQEHIYLFGHSLGGNVAPIIVNQEGVAGIMVYGTVVKPWQEYLIDMARYVQPFSEADITATEKSIPLLRAIQEKIYQQDVPLSDLSAEEKELLTNWQNLKEDKYLFDRDISFWKNLNAHNFVAHWNQIEVPTLAMYGAMDVHAVSPLDAEHIAMIVDKNHPGKGAFQIVEQTDHFFASMESKLEVMEYLNNGLIGQVVATRFNTEMPNIIDQWIETIANKQANEQFILSDNLIPQAATTMSTMDVESADIDQDGDQDLILATEYGPNKVLFNENGTFAEDPNRLLPQLKTYVAPYKGEDSEDIAVADFDQDGDLDLFFISEDTENHELLLNDGKGKFAFGESQIPKIGQANGVLVYDFNKDNYLDILIGIRGQNEVYINQNGASFANKTADYWPNNLDSTQDLILVDIDNDGDEDIVEGIEAGSNNIYINERGKFVEDSKRLPDMSAYETRKVIAGDVDQDGDQDLFYCNVGWSGTTNPQNVLLLNDGKGYFQLAEKAIPKDLSTTLDAYFLDLNDDGKPDIITTGLSDTRNFKVWLNTSTEQGVQFIPDQSLFPKLRYQGGISLIVDTFMSDGRIGIYLGNHKGKDHFLLQQKQEG